MYIPTSPKQMTIVINEVMITVVTTDMVTGTSQELSANDVSLVVTVTVRTDVDITPLIKNVDITVLVTVDVDITVLVTSDVDITALQMADVDITVLVTVDVDITVLVTVDVDITVLGLQMLILQHYRWQMLILQY
jgi:hypothetical protein